MSRRGRGEGSVRLRKDGRWEARLRYIDAITGYAERISFFGATRADAVAQLDEARRRLRSRKPARDESVTLSRFLEVWLSDVVKPTKRAWTHHSYANIVANHLVPSRLGSMPLRDIRELHVQRELIARSKAPTRTQQLAIVVLRLALEQARTWGMLETNPAAGIAAPKPARRELRVLSADEARRFLEAARDDRLYAMYYLALDTGMRQGELFALQWRDVDLERGTITVVRTLAGAPKTKASRRRIELGKAAVSVLRDHEAKCGKVRQSATLVFPSPTGNALSPSNVRIRSFLPIQKAAKIDPPIRFHDLRHTAATLMLGAGVHPKIVSERLGHATISITMDTYQHVSPTMQREVAEIMGKVLSPAPKRKRESGVKAGGQKVSRGTSRQKKKRPKG